MSDNKYGRLYPERAVAPLLDLAFSLINDGRLGQATHDALRDAVTDLNALAFPPDEPLFLLRGQDKLAPKVVRAYADEVERTGAGLNALHILDFADRMERWTPRKLPD